MNTFFLTLDLEEWYHLDYLKSFDVDTSVSLVPHVYSFLDTLDELGIRMTVFALVDVARENPTLIRDLVARGHEVATHGYDHELLYEKTNDQFSAELVQAKRELEDLLGQEIRGHRAACYSIDDEKLRIVRECGFAYDSSFIRFAEHPLYRTPELKGFGVVDDLVHECNGFYEFEIPTVDICGKHIPLSGGGYYRLFPWSMFLALFRRYSKSHSNFLFYVHPFELTAQGVRLPVGISMANRFRFSVGRNNNVAKLEKLLRYTMEQGYKFCTMSDYIEKQEQLG